MPQDEIVYRSGNIIISKTLARFGGVTYPVNGIGSVYVMKPKRLAGIVVGVLVMLLGIAMLGDRSGGGGGWLFLIVGGVILLAAIGRPHKLMLRTASGDQQAYESRSAKELFEIKSAIERAVVLRG